MSVRKTIYRMDRRDLLKWTATAGAGSFFMANFEEAFAQGKCDKLDNFVATKASPAEAELFYWIDGHFAAPWGSDLKTCAKIAFHVDIPQTITSYVENVILAEAVTRKIVQEQHIPSSQKTSSNRAPYIVFDNLELDTAKDYSVFYTVREGSSAKIYKFDIEAKNIRESRFDFSHLGPAAMDAIPLKFRQDMITANHSFAQPSAGMPGADLTFGVGNITSPYHNFAGLPPHNVKTQIKSIIGNGNFEIALSAMHEDRSESHFMRYFLVMDPVGRIMGGLKRSYGDATYVNSSVDSKFVHIMNRGMVGDTNGYSQQERDEMGARNILDCPYVMIFIEDIHDALARVTLRLR